MLIRCPECGKEISDKATACPNCGCPSSEWEEAEEKPMDSMDILHEIVYKYADDQKPLMIRELCNRVGIKEQDAKKIIDCAVQKKQVQSHIPDDLKPYLEKEFEGVYRYTLFGDRQEVYCPRCRSANCSHYKEQKIVPGKTKTRYSLNLNPLRPFTLVNKKEKVLKKDRVETKDKFICNKCGLIFD